MKTTAILISFIAFYIAILSPFTLYMKERQLLMKIGYTPQPVIIRSLATDHKSLAAVLLIFKVTFHAGQLLQVNPSQHSTPEESKNTFTLLKTASRLDPYNMDGYYLAQALAWDRQNIIGICKLLEYGMQYRKWDFYLPFFAGFNYSYFLKDYSNAAKNYQKAQKLTGNPLLGRLTSRYLYETGETAIAISYLETMIKSTNQKTIKKSYQTRLHALQEIRRIEKAVQKFTYRQGQKPRNIESLFAKGYLSNPLIDPYGGRFYLDKNSKPRSTSNFAFANKKNK